jgi:hypothetical protein
MMATDLTIAKTIRDQIKTIDPRALWAWGAKDFVGSNDSIQFTVGGMTRWKGKVIVKLNSSDLYDIRFFRSRGTKILEDVTTGDVFAEDLVRIIDAKVG